MKVNKMRVNVQLLYNKLFLWFKEILSSRKNKGYSKIQGKNLDKKSFGEIIRDLEMDGKLGHFKSCSLFHTKDSEGNMFFGTRNFWIEAGVDPIPVFLQYLEGEQKIDNIPDAIGFIKPVLDRLADELMTQIRSTNTDVMLRRLFILFEDIYAFYCKDRKTREEVANTYLDFSDATLEGNCDITLSLLNGLNVMIENCVVFQNEEESENCKGIDLESADDLFDSDLLIKTYLYALLSQHHTLLNLSKNSKKNYLYCSGIIVNPYNQVPVEGIIYHPLLYTSVLLRGNQKAISPKDEVAFLKQIDTTPIGQGFQSMYGISFQDVMTAFVALLEGYPVEIATIVSVEELKKYIVDKCLFNINPDNLIEHFSITKANLDQYISKKEPYIFRIGCNQFRLEIRPIVLLENKKAFISPAAIFKATNVWGNYVKNGGRPYTNIEEGQGDAVIDGFAKREKELGKQLVDLLFEKLKQHYPNAEFKDKDVNYNRIFGEKEENYGDYDIVYYVGEELFLIEAKYFSDSPTINLLIGDYNKIFKDGGYYEHCRKRYDLVETEAEKMKTFIKAEGDVKVHYLFVSSKPLEIEFQDEDKLVTFLSVANFDKYIDGKIEYEDGTILRPTHTI